MDHKALQLSSKAWFFFLGFVFLFSLLGIPDGSTDWISSDGHNVNVIVCFVFCLFFPIFMDVKRRPPRIDSNMPHKLLYLLVKEIEAHLECSPIRFPDPVLYTEETDTEYHIFLGLICRQMD